MPTRNVVITDDQEAFVQALVAAGRFQNASEALRAGLRLLEAEEAEFEVARARLRESLAQADAGDYAPGTGEEAIRRAFVRARERRGL